MAAMAAMAAVTASTTAEGAEKVSSPDGRLTVTIDAVDGMPVYEVEYDGEKILGRSPLGFRSNVGDFSKGVTIASSSTGSVERSFDQDRIKKSHIDYKANRLSIGFKNETGKFDMEWEVADNDIAFRYIIGPQGKDGETRSMVIDEEATGFRFPEETTVFMTPQSDPMIAWKRTKPSYEEFYITDAPLGTPSEYGNGFTFPALRAKTTATARLPPASRCRAKRRGG